MLVRDRVFRGIAPVRVPEESTVDERIGQSSDSGTKQEFQFATAAHGRLQRRWMAGRSAGRILSTRFRRRVGLDDPFDGGAKYGADRDPLTVGLHADIGTRTDYFAL